MLGLQVLGVHASANRALLVSAMLLPWLRRTVCAVSQVSRRLQRRLYKELMAGNYGCAAGLGWCPCWRPRIISSGVQRRLPCCAALRLSCCRLPCCRLPCRSLPCCACRGALWLISGLARSSPPSTHTLDPAPPPPPCSYVKLAVATYHTLLLSSRPEKSNLLANELVVHTVVKRRT